MKAIKLKKLKEKNNLKQLSLSLENSKKKDRYLNHKLTFSELQKKQNLREISESNLMTNYNNSIKKLNLRHAFNKTQTSFNSLETLPTNNHSRLNSTNLKNEESKKIKMKINGLILEMETQHKSQLKGRGTNLDLNKNINKTERSKRSKSNKTRTRTTRFKTEVNKRNLDKLFGFTKDIIKDESVNDTKVLMQKPKNNVEMNRVLINGFGLNKGNTSMSIDYSKRFNALSERYFNIMENMKEQKIKLQIENFDKLKESIMNTNGNIMKKPNLINNKLISKWEKEYFKNEYNNNKMSNSNYQLYKKEYNEKINKEIKKRSKNYANVIFSMDCEEYENVNEKEKVYDSTNGLVSYRNLKRVVRLINIQKNGDDDEKQGKIKITPNQIRKEKEKNAEKIILALNFLGPPKYIKSSFKGITLRKFQSVSGNFFGNS
jgi:hypothetical protein